MSGVELSSLSYITRVQAFPRRRITPLRGAGLSPEEASEQSQKQRGAEARKRLTKSLSPPEQQLVQNSPKVENPRPTPVENLSWEQAPAVPYDEASEVPNSLPAFLLQRWRVIVRETAAKHGVTLNDIVSPRRDKKTVWARHECCWRLKEELPASLPRIGKWLGGRDHTSILHGIRKHLERMENAREGD